MLAFIVGSSGPVELLVILIMGGVVIPFLNSQHETEIGNNA